MSRRGVAAGLLALASLVVLAIVLSSGSSPYAVHAEFGDAAGLRADFAVRVQGVAVGRVAQITVTPRDTAMVKLELDPSVVPIGSGARASIIPSNLLGEKYVSLDEGDRRAALPSGTTIPLARTRGRCRSAAGRQRLRRTVTAGSRCRSCRPPSSCRAYRRSRSRRYREPDRARAGPAPAL
jgi:ABC-type transporter Mla subunit MlaD